MRAISLIFHPPLLGDTNILVFGKVNIFFSSPIRSLLLFSSSLFQVLHQYAVFQHPQPITYSKMLQSQYTISV